MAIKEAQLSSNDETKSSAGDKYETGRAMAQLEIEKNSSHLSEALLLKQKLEALEGKSSGETIKAGTLVKTNHGSFYLAIPAGQIIVDDKPYFAISIDSPIGAKLLGLRPGAAFTFRDKSYVVESVC